MMISRCSSGMASSFLRSRSVSPSKSWPNPSSYSLPLPAHGRSERDRLCYAARQLKATHDLRAAWGRVDGPEGGAGGGGRVPATPSSAAPRSTVRLARLDAVLPGVAVRPGVASPPLAVCAARPLAAEGGVDVGEPALRFAPRDALGLASSAPSLVLVPAGARRAELASILGREDRGAAGVLFMGLPRHVSGTGAHEASHSV